jgi:predicted small metal-binding protein
MQVLLSCTECQYEEWGSTDKELMNKIIIWNHVKKEHPATAERIMRVYQHVPSSLFNVHAAHTSKIVQKLNPRFA